MHTDHVSGFIMLILDDEDHVKSGQDGGHKVNVLLALRVVPASKHAVGRSQHGTAGVESCGDAGLEVKR